MLVVTNTLALGRLSVFYSNDTNSLSLSLSVIQWQYSHVLQFIIRHRLKSYYSKIVGWIYLI